MVRKLSVLENNWIAKQLSKITTAVSASAPIEPLMGPPGEPGNISDIAAVSNKFVSSVVSGVPVLTQPTVGNLSGFGTGVATALAVNIGSAGAPVVLNGAGGTPASMTATNLTGTASGLTAGAVTTNANLTGPITSSGNATAIASQTGTGTKFVVDTSPVLITPTLGVAAATSINFGGTALSTYAEGTWTPNDASGASLTLTVNYASYTRIGRVVFIQLYINYPVTASGSAAAIGGLPFTSLNASGNAYFPWIVDSSAILATSAILRVNPNTTNASFILATNGAVLNSSLSNTLVIVSGFYFV